MQRLSRKSTITREAVLAELALMAEGRHPDCNTITGRFIRDAELQQAAEILRDAIQAESYGHRHGEIPVPPAWLLPA